MVKINILKILCIFLIVISAIIHLIIVTSIIRQPLDVNSTSGENQSLVWGLYNDTVHRQGPGADFFAVYHAGVMMQRGFTPFEREEKPQLTPYYYPFRYHPIIAKILGYYFILFPPLTAYRLWFFVIEIVLILFIFLLLHIMKSNKWRCVIVSILLLSTPYYLELHMGQFTFITLTLFAIGILIKEKLGEKLHPIIKEIIFIILYAGSIILKTVTLITSFCLFRFKRYWLSIVLVLSILFFVSKPYFPDDIKIFYYLNFSRTVGGFDSGNFSLLYLIHLLSIDRKILWLNENWDQFVRLWRFGILAVTAIITVTAKYKKPIILSCGLLLAHFISYIHVWEHHMSGVIIIGVLLFIEIIDAKSYKWRKLAIVITALSLITLALPSPFYWFDAAKNPGVWDPSLNWTPYESYALIMSKIGPVIALYLVSIIVMLKDGVKIRRNYFAS